MKVVVQQKIASISTILGKKSSVSLMLENRHDCVGIDHSWYDWRFVAEHASLVVNTRNAFKGVSQNGNVVKA